MPCEDLAGKVLLFLHGEGSVGDVKAGVKHCILGEKDVLPPRVVRVLAVMHDLLTDWEGSMLERLNLSMLCQLATGCEGMSRFGVKVYLVRREGGKRLLMDVQRLGLREEAYGEVEAFIMRNNGEATDSFRRVCWLE